METTSDRGDRPLPPARSRRTVLAGEREPASAGAPLPPYVPGRTIAPPADEAVESVEPAGPHEAADLPWTEPIATHDDEETLGGWQAGTVAPFMDPVDEVLDEGGDFPFEPGDDEPEELVLEAVEEAVLEAVEEAEASAFPWELNEATPAEAEEDAALHAAEPAPERSPWEELREAAAQSIGVAAEEEGSVADVDLSAALDSADRMAGEFAERLEALAGRLRTEGLRAIDRALTEGDRLDTAVAGFLTAFIAARDR